VKSDIILIAELGIIVANVLMHFPFAKGSQMVSRGQQANISAINIARYVAKFAVMRTQTAQYAKLRWETANTLLIQSRSVSFPPNMGGE
jgi:hypothetical protein